MTRKFTVYSRGNGPEDDDWSAEEVCSGSLRECIPCVAYGFSRPDWAARPEPDYSGPLSNVRWLRWSNYRSTSAGDSYDEERELFFPEHITPASRARICRLFGLIHRAFI